MVFSTEMDSTKFHEYMRPRYSNPTYNSNRVGTSLGAFTGNTYLRLVNNQSAQKEQNIEVNQKNYPSPSSPKLQFQQSNNKQPSFAHNPQTSYLKAYGSHQLGDSRFSRFGSQSLITSNITDQQVYEKQNKNYNIISIKPKQYQQTIRKYPKFHLQDQDGNFYRKMTLQNQYKETHRYAQNMERQSYLNRNKPSYTDRMAGKLTQYEPKDIHPHFLNEKK